MDAVVLDQTRLQIGLDATHVEKVRISEYQKLKEEGVLIQLDITGGSLFMTSVDWSELGISIESTRAKWLTKGRKYLFPKEQVAELQSVISKMRQGFARLTHDIIGMRPYRYLHYKQYAAWTQAWNSLKIELEQVKASMLEGYDDAVDRLAAEYNQIAAEAWKAVMDAGEEMVVFKGHPYEDLDEFTDAVVSAVLAKMPSREKIGQDIQCGYHTALIQGMDDIAREERRAAQIRAEAQALAFDTAKAESELEHQRRMNLLSEEEKRVQIETMMKAEAERIRAEMTTITSPLEETFVSLRRYMAETASEMIRSIQSNGGKIHGKTAQKALETLTALFEMRTIVDDSRLCERLNQLKAAIGPVGEARTKDTPERDTEQVVKSLEAIQSLVESAREDFLAEPSRFALLEVE